MNLRQFMCQRVGLITQAAAMTVLTPWWLRNRVFAEPFHSHPNSQLLAQSGQVHQMQSSQSYLTI